jgi:hypothetical protein
MMDNFFSGIQKFFNKDRVMLLGIFLCLGVLMMSYANGKWMKLDPMESGPTSVKNEINQRSIPESTSIASNPPYVSNNASNPSDLLPKDSNSQWSSLNPVNTNSSEMPDGLLSAGYNIGLDTIGNTLRNANYQLRSDPIIPKANVGPWNQSTIDPDLMRVPLEVGMKS